MFGSDGKYGIRVEANTVYNGRSWRTSPIEVILRQNENVIMTKLFKNRRLAEAAWRRLNRAVRTHNLREVKKAIKEDWYATNTGGATVTFPADSPEEAEALASSVRGSEPIHIDESTVRPGDRVRLGPKVGTVEQVADEEFEDPEAAVKVRWDDGSRSIELASDVRLVE